MEERKRVKVICVAIPIVGDAGLFLNEVAKNISLHIGSGFDNKIGDRRSPVLKIKFCFEVTDEQLIKVRKIISNIGKKRTTFLVSCNNFIIDNRKLSIEIDCEGVLKSLRKEIFEKLLQEFPEKAVILKQELERPYFPKVTIGIIPIGKVIEVGKFIKSKKVFDEKNLLQNIEVRTLNIYYKLFPQTEWKLDKKYNMNKISFRTLAEATNAD